jgi:hypothetical protein
MLGLENAIDTTDRPGVDGVRRSGVAGKEGKKIPHRGESG